MQVIRTEYSAWFWLEFSVFHCQNVEFLNHSNGALHDFTLNSFENQCFWRRNLFKNVKNWCFQDSFRTWEETCVVVSWKMTGRFFRIPFFHLDPEEGVIFHVFSFSSSTNSKIGSSLCRYYSNGSRKSRQNSLVIFC